jgi:hypothetical protein
LVANGLGSCLMIGPPSPVFLRVHVQAGIERHLAQLAPVLGRTVATLTGHKGRAVTLGLSIAVASVLFGLYHLAHSGPFNQVPVALFLTWVGVATSLVYLVGRDVYATVIAHNLLGMTGIINTAPLDVFRQPLYSLYALAILALVALVSTHVIMTHVGGHASG